MIAAFDNPWCTGWREGHAPAKDEKPSRWCGDNVFLANSPMGSKYQEGGFTDDILNDLADPEVYESDVVGHTGMGKSAILECASCYVISEAPGPTLVIGQTDKTTLEWADTRMNKAFEMCESVSRLLPTGKERHSRKKTAIIFRHMEYLIGAANLTTTQEKSMRYVFGDEVWAWDHGIIKEAQARHHDRWNRKTMFLAQGGTEGDDWHGHTKNGLGFDRAFNCPECGTQQIYKWSQVKYEELRDGNNEIDWPAIVPTVHYECEHPDCGEKFEDTARGRKRMAENAVFVCRHNAHVPGRVTRYIPAMANPRIALFKLVEEWLLAEEAWKNGDKVPRRQFVQKRLAQFWVEKPEVPILHTGGEAYSLNSHNQGEQWPGEHARHMRIDVQKGHFWVTVRAWKMGGQSRIVWEGRIDTWQGLFEVQERFGLEHRDVFIDGRYGIDEVVRQIVAHCGPAMENHWNILIGQDNDKGYMYDVGTAKRPRKVWRIYSKWQRGITSRHQHYRTISFSNLRAKDALAGLMEQPDGHFGVATDVSKNYIEQMQSEVKREVKPKVWRWEKVKSHTHNHQWDTETMGIVAASIRGILKIETADER